MPAPQKIRDLVESFDRNIEQYKRAANETQARTQLERQIAHTDKEIDSLVYALYGLTAEEIKIIEEEK